MLVGRVYVGTGVVGLYFCLCDIWSWRSMKVGMVKETPVTSCQKGSEKKITQYLCLKLPGPGWAFV